VTSFQEIRKIDWIHTRKEINDGKNFRKIKDWLQLGHERPKMSKGCHCEMHIIQSKLGFPG
jgi:hypothetical protein